MGSLVILARPGFNREALLRKARVSCQRASRAYCSLAYELSLLGLGEQALTHDPQSKRDRPLTVSGTEYTHHTRSGLVSGTVCTHQPRSGL
eukprot:4275437-Pyramimonas_sp.AAC.1